MKKLINFKQAQADPKAMKQFVAEHEGEQIERSEFDKVFESMTTTNKDRARKQ